MREKQLTFNGLDIESASVWVWRCNIQTQEASHILLQSNSRAQHFLKSDLQLNTGYIWQIILFFHSCAGMLYSRGGDFWVNKCVGIHSRKVKYPGDVLCCDYGNSCIINSTWLLSLHSCCSSGHQQCIFKPDNGSFAPPLLLFTPPFCHVGELLDKSAVEWGLLWPLDKVRLRKDSSFQNVTVKCCQYDTVLRLPK